MIKLLTKDETVVGKVYGQVGLYSHETGTTSTKEVQNLKGANIFKRSVHGFLFLAVSTKSHAVFGDIMPFGNLNPDPCLVEVDASKVEKILSVHKGKL